MKTEDFSTTLVVEASPAAVFNAVNNVRGWWSENIDGDTGSLDSEFAYHYEDVHRCKMKITELVPNKKVVWTVLDNHFKFTQDQSEWKGDQIIFDISQSNGSTHLAFTQKGLVPAKECYQVCHDAWTHYIQDSLKQLILTGEGKATPKAEEDSSAEIQRDSGSGSDNTSEQKCIRHRLLIKVPVEIVYEALTTQKGLAGWWTPDTIAKPELGATLRFAFGPEYYKEMKVTELKPYSSVKWLCLKAYDEWIGTTLSFKLEAHSKGCILTFNHAGWKAYSPEFESCSYDWALFFRSLKFLCETGKGFPYPEYDK